MFRVVVLTIAVLLSSCGVSTPILQALPGAISIEQYQRVPFIAARNVSEDGRKTVYKSRRGELSAGSCYANPGEVAGERFYAVRKDLDEVITGAENAGDGSVVLYMHGFNESFENSCARAATMQSELGLGGRLVLFSWPTNNNSWSYRADLRDLQWAREPLSQLITQLIDDVGAENITLIGHSLGARGMVETLMTMPELDGPENRIGKLILLAPDIAREDFLANSQTISERAERIVVFVSGRDRALRVSRSFHREARLGQGWFEPFGNVQIIDVTNAGGVGFSGHLYHLRSPTVIAHLRDVLSDKGDAGLLDGHEIGGYWRLQPIQQ